VLVLLQLFELLLSFVSLNNTQVYRFNPDELPVLFLRSCCSSLSFC
jgi:hypothetical protein